MSRRTGRPVSRPHRTDARRAAVCREMSTVPVEVTYCVVNTEQRQFLVRCLDVIATERQDLPFTTEVLVLDNASRDGSAGAARNHPACDTLIVNEQRRGKGE